MMQRMWCRNVAVCQWALFATMVMFASVAQAKIVYVATNGSNSGNGSSGSPYKTVQRAMWDARAGDSIYLKGGTYYPTKDEWIGDNSGTSGAYITIQSAPNEWAILDGTNSNASLFVVNSSYIRFQWLEVRNSKQRGIDVYGNNNQVLNCTVHDNQRSGIHMQGDNHQVKDNKVFRNCKVNSARTMNGMWPAGIDGYQCRWNIVSGNTVYENWGEGILFQASDGCHAGYNDVRDNYSVNMYLDSSTNCTYEQNKIYSYWKSDFYRYDVPATGIQLANEWNWDYPQFKLSGNIIRNNNVTDTRIAFYLWGGGPGGGNMKNTDVYGNTFQKATQAVVQIDSGDHTGSKIRDNTFGRQWSQTVSIPTNTGISQSNNTSVY